MFGGYKTCISQLLVKHCEQADHHPEIQHHLEKVEAIEVLHCTILILYSRCVLQGTAGTYQLEILQGLSVR